MSSYRLLLHVDTDDNAINVALRNFMNYAAALKNEPHQTVLVANGAAVTLLKAENGQLAESLQKATERGLEVRVCNNALNERGIRPEELFAQCRVIPAGMVELVRLQNDGFAYVKP